MAKREPAAVILSVSCEGSGSLGLSRSRFRTRFCASLRKYSRSSCEAWEAVVASNLTPLPLASLNRGRDPQGSLGTVPWAGGTETAEGNWRERYKSRLAKRLARRLREDSSLRAPRRVFRHKQVRNNVLSSAARWAPHIPRVIAAHGCA